MEVRFTHSRTSTTIHLYPYLDTHTSTSRRTVPYRESNHPPTYPLISPTHYALTSPRPPCRLPARHDATRRYLPRYLPNAPIRIAHPGARARGTREASGTPGAALCVACLGTHCSSLRVFARGPRGWRCRGRHGGAGEGRVGVDGAGCSAVQRSVSKCSMSEWSAVSKFGWWHAAVGDDAGRGYER